MMHKTAHAQQMTDRFRELVNNAGESLSDERYDELVLLIEAGIDTALLERLEKMADQLQKLAHDIRNDAEYFD